MEKIYYLDAAATTRALDGTVDVFEKVSHECFYNPSASYAKAFAARKVLEESRKTLSNLLCGDGGKFYFTSSATESNNTVFKGVHIRAGQTVLISAGEHPSVYESALALKNRGINVLTIPIDENGKVVLSDFENLLKSNDVALVSVIHVSNENGVINDIKNLVLITKKISPSSLFHSDGVQAFGKIKVSLRELGVDLYTVSAHKVYAPRGIAGLWVKDRVLIDSLLLGGGQEGGFRSSTENVTGAAMFAFSAKRAVSKLEENYNIVKNLKDELLNKLAISGAGKYLKVNSMLEGSPYIVSIGFEKIKGEVLANSLESDGVLISTGSACSSKKAGNRILEAMGVDLDYVIGSVRVGFDPNMNYDIDYIVSCFEKNVVKFEANVKR